MEATMGLFGKVAGAVGGAIKDGAEALGDAVGEAADVAERVGDAGGWIANRACSVDGKALCGGGSVLGGIWSGAFNSLGGMVRGTGEFFEGGLSAVGNLLQGRFQDAAHDAAAAVGGSISVTLSGISIVGTIVDEAWRHWDRNQLRYLVSDLINDKFAHDAQLRSDVRQAAGLDKTDWGMNVKATHRLLTFHTEGDKHVNLKKLHDNGIINLYELSGHDHPGWKTLTYPTAVVYTESPTVGLASRDEIDDYLQSGNPGLKMAAMHPKHCNRSKRYASRVTPDVGIRLSWDDNPFFVEGTTPNRFPIRWPDRFLADHAQLLRDNVFRDGTIATECTIEAFGVLFPFDHLRKKVARGITLGMSGFNATGGCGRDDDCCTSIETGLPNSGTSVSYMWPRNAGARLSNEFILAHEIGHWLGLCHKGHLRFSEIMFTAEGTGPFDILNAAGSLFFNGPRHPRFTKRDGLNIWKFILEERAGKCFAVQQGGVE
ncbi:hypothetical protein [Arthrobacter sp. ES3-54]|uniref:hypothetical protein n=1 Tax=Arthrobacter sp. ES3-54 TaxID=1502991 RepID=UPI0024070D98|nr:hypothetical protein [Arthrobacter sp. ES3-54]MDF9750285.1 hypothetical protein [Arthrobacter sp. ES3-54]